MDIPRACRRQLSRCSLLAAVLISATAVPARATPVNFDFQSYALKNGGVGNHAEMDAVPAGLAFSANGGLIGTQFSGENLEVMATGQRVDPKPSDEERKALDGRQAAIRPPETKTPEAATPEEGPFAYLSDAPAGLGVCAALDEKGQCATGDSMVGGDKWMQEVLTLTFSGDVTLLKLAFSGAGGKPLEDGKYLLNGTARSFGDGDFSLLDAASIWTFQPIDTAFYVAALSVEAGASKPVPEPGTLSLLALAVVGLAGMLRRRRQSDQYRNMGLP